MKNVKITGLLVVIGLLVGCASVPMTSPTLDAEAKSFSPEPGKASIYIYRPGQIMNFDYLGFQVVLDGRIVGSLAPHTFQLLSVQPGKHTVVVQGYENVQEQKLDAEAGKTYFYSVKHHVGWVNPRVYIDPISEEKGRKEVMNSKRADTINFQ